MKPWTTIICAIIWKIGFGVPLKQHIGENAKKKKLAKTGAKYALDFFALWLIWYRHMAI